MDHDSNTKELTEDATMLNFMTEDSSWRDEEDEQLNESKLYERPSSSDMSAAYATETDKDEHLEEPKHYENATSFDLLTGYMTEDNDSELFEEPERYEDMLSNLLATEYTSEKNEDEESIVHESDFGQITIADGIERVEKLRLEQTNLIARRTNVMKMLVELYEKNLVSDTYCITANNEIGRISSM